MLAPLAGKNADDLESDVLQADFLSERRNAAEQLAHDGLANQADLAGVAHIPVRKRLPFGHVVPVAHLQVRGRGAGDVVGHPIAVAVNDLRARPDDRRGSQEQTGIRSRRPAHPGVSDSCCCRPRN